MKLGVQLEIMAVVGEFARSLHAVCRARGVATRTELARLAGISPRTLGRWLADPARLSVKRMVRLAVALGAAVHASVEDEDAVGHWRAEVGLSRSARPNLQKAKRRSRIIGNLARAAQLGPSPSAPASA